VHFGGNWFVDLRAGRRDPSPGVDLGELSTARDFAGGNLFALDCGTSFAAPKVANLAARVLGRRPNASANLVRALLVAHARIPEAATARLPDDDDEVLRLVGYGQPSEAVLDSTENRVTLISEASLAENFCHFFEVPLPPDFRAPPARRRRRITVALAHTPVTRRTRLEYKLSEFSFRLVRAREENEVFRIFKRAPPKQKQEDAGGEAGSFAPSISRRSKGTVQRGTWTISQFDGRWAPDRLFIVVTRSVPEWARGKLAAEPYALVVVVEDSGDVRLYTQIREQIALRDRARARARG
jgi:hypothetical protein